MARLKRLSPSTILGILGPAAALLWIVFVDRANWQAVWAVGLCGTVAGSIGLWRRWAPTIAYRVYVRQTFDSHVLLVILTLGLALQRALTEGITSDGCLHFAHLRSLIFDRDLDIGPELAALDLPARPSHVVTLGSGFVWLPLYLLVRLADAAGLVHEPGRLAGLSGPYAQAALVSSFLAAAVGLFALHQRLRREFGAAVALAASVLLAVATPLAWYAIYEPSMTHAASFGLVAIFILAAERWRAAPPARAAAVALGILYGIILSIRSQDGLFGVFLLAAIAASWADRAGRPARLGGVACFVAGAAPLVIVQLALLSALLARQPFPLVGETGYLHLFESRWLDALFSSRHGFFSWTPIAYVAAIGTVCYLRHDRVWASCAIFVLAAMSWVNGSADDWWGGWAFGGRRFTSSLSALGPGLALTVAWTKARPMLALAPLVVAAAGWNVMLMQQYHHERIPRDAAISFKTIVRQQGDLLTEQMEVYPFAFPANVWFAWRERLPVDRYDLLAPEPLEPRIHLRLGPNQARFLLDGWEQLSSHQDDGQPVVATGESARLAVPLDPPRAPPLALEVDASTRPSRHPIRVRVAVAVNGQVVGTVEVEPDRRTFLFAGGEASSRAVWRRGYNHLTFRKLSAHVRGDDGTWRSATDRPGNWPVAVYEVRIDPRPAGFTR